MLGWVFFLLIFLFGFLFLTHQQPQAMAGYIYVLILSILVSSSNRISQELKVAINAAGGDISLMPLDREDYQRALRESEELRRANGTLNEELRKSTKRESMLEQELEGVLAGGGGGGGGGSMASEGGKGSVAAKEERLAAEIEALHANLEEMRNASAKAEAETHKLATILKETLAAAPVDIHAELYQKKMMARQEGGGAKASLGVPDDPMAPLPTAADDGGGAGGGGGAASSPNRPSRNSIEALAHQVKMARNYQLKKNVGEAMQRVGLDNAELSEMAKTYEVEHLDFNVILEDVIHKAQKYRAERTALANQIKEFKMETHFLKLELKLYKELEVKLKVNK